MIVMFSRSVSENKWPYTLLQGSSRLSHSEETIMIYLVFQISRFSNGPSFTQLELLFDTFQNLYMRLSLEITCSLCVIEIHLAAEK